MPLFLVPYGYGEAQFVEKRSKFIARVWRCESEREALDHISEMRTRHWDATHNVYAYFIRDGQISRYSDDGEPQGTAGVPVLEVFRRENIQNYCCVVTRYFGGVLLGAGGLVRAYAHSAKLALEAAGVAEMRSACIAVISCPYQLYDRIRAELASLGGEIRDSNYGVDIKLEISIPKENYGPLADRMNELSSGSISPVFISEEYIPVKIER
ncbi:MAG: YigZ family protein [Clostridiales bacterium]|nr:YigZ family protein [Clostridiales bacterium]